ncbi:CobW family GTP-binding protein [Roseobacter sp. EG26]|uniref:CobW family GTP-binding protein n=1 Tax=Roseobacter sp. EG26 TaxID=3412477 RepID=UPI003CE53656
MSPVPLSVIGGYLGAGKTTLINQLLGLDHGLRLAILVNDFGAINIDAALLQSASEDTIELTNGCVCCTMSGDLFFTIGDLLDRRPRPDHILVEASGIADPAKIAAVSLAEKELRYAGIITVIDGLNVERQLADPRISEQVKDQFRSADLIAVSKASREKVASLLKGEGVAPCVSTSDIAAVTGVVFGSSLLSLDPAPGTQPHPAYVQWSEPAPLALSKDDLDARLSSIPPGLLRLKALLPNTAGRYWELHVVGAQIDLQKLEDVQSLGVVAIGLRDTLSSAKLRAWWMGP